MYVHNEDVWSTVVSIHMDAPQLDVTELDAARDDVVRFVHDVDEVFSTFKPNSLVSQYRRGELDENALEARTDRAARDLLEVVGLCRKALVVTRGAFDPWKADGGFDPSGLVKGWAAQRACALLKVHGITRGYVNAGGDVFSFTDDEPWIGGVQDPDDRLQVVKVSSISGDGASCTSGTYERGDHVVDPHSGGRSAGARSASVIGPDGALADAYATAVCVDGERAMEWFRDLGDDWSLFLIPHGERIGYAYGNAWT